VPEVGTISSEYTTTARSTCCAADAARTEWFTKIIAVIEKIAVIGKIVCQAVKRLRLHGQDNVDVARAWLTPNTRRA
jgi:hypothetical protein